MDANIALRDELEIYRVYANGEKELILAEEDLITTIGLQTVAKLLWDANEPQFGWIAIGEGATGAGAGDTTLEDEIIASGGEKATSDDSIVDSVIAQFENTFAFTASFAVTESGLFNAAGANTGDMLCRQTFSAINVVSGDSLLMRWKITVS